MTLLSTAFGENQVTLTRVAHAVCRQLHLATGCIREKVNGSQSVSCMDTDAVIETQTYGIITQFAA